MSNTYKAVWSPEDGEFVGTVDEFPSLSFLAHNRVDALVGIEKLVEYVKVDLVEADPLVTKLALDLLARLEEEGVSRPGIFGNESRGILLEWSSTKNVVSIEIIEELKFELLSLEQGSNEATQITVESVEDAVNFILLSGTKEKF